MGVDDVLMDIGGLGLFQKRAGPLVAFAPLAQSALTFVQVFIAVLGDHWCKVGHWEDEHCEEWNITESECAYLKRSLSIPYEDDEYSQCSMYNLSGVDLSTAFDTQESLSRYDVIKCDSGWYFDDPVYASTIVQDWELVCDLSAVPNVLQSLFFVGYLLGSLIMGRVADRFGRWATFFAGALLAGLCGFASALSPNVYVFGILRVLSAALSYGTTLVGFVLVSEYATPEHRFWVSTSIWFGFSFGYIYLSGMASITSNWRLLIVLCSAPYILVVALAWLFLTESPRWLSSKKEYEKATKALAKIAKVNGKQLPKNVVDTLEEEQKREANRKEVGIIAFVREKTLRWYMLSLLFNWFVVGLAFFGISLGSALEGIDLYLATLFTGLFHILSTVLTMVAMNVKLLGRRLATFMWFLLSGIACAGTIFTPDGPWSFVVANIGKVSINAAWSTLYVHSGEILPTPLRSLGVGTCSISARVGSIIAPLLLYLQVLFESLPLIVFSVTSFAGALSVLILPETINKHLPDTIEESVLLKKKSSPRAKEEEDNNNREANGKGPAYDNNECHVIEREEDVL